MCASLRYLRTGDPLTKLVAAGVDLYIWGNAETSSSIIAACIPILRVLVRDVHTSARQYYVSGNDGNTFGGGVSKGVGTAGQSRAQQSIHMDNWSERSMLDKAPESSPERGSCHV